jgi:hypothetical protein
MSLAKALTGFSTTGDAMNLILIVQFYRLTDILIHQQQVLTDRQLILYGFIRASQCALHL